MRVHFKLTVYVNDLLEAKNAVYEEAAKFLNTSAEDCKAMLDLELSVSNKFEKTDASEYSTYEVVAQANLKNSVIRPNLS